MKQHERRARALRRLQRGIERYYGLERAPDVALFVEDGAESERETLLVRETEDALELKLVLPNAAPPAGANDEFLHPESSEEGHRYRMANELAARFTVKLLDIDARSARLLLQRFYRAGQSDKIRLARAA